MTGENVWITFQSPGEVVVTKNKAVMSKKPLPYLNLQEQIHSEKLFNTKSWKNECSKDVVSFILKPIGKSVYVTNVNFVHRYDIIKN